MSGKNSVESKKSDTITKAAQPAPPKTSKERGELANQEAAEAQEAPPGKLHDRYLKKSNQKSPQYSQYS